MVKTNNIVEETSLFVKKSLEGEGTGHDWWHIWRVWQLAKRIASEEKANMLLVELGILLHDIADWKAHDGDTHAGGKASREWLESLKVDDSIIQQVVEIVNNVSFKGAGVEDQMRTIEGKIVQDADRLDAIGAMGIARVFTYGGSKGSLPYNPEIPIQMANTFEMYKTAGQTSINHFYEKLLLLKDRMHTETAKKIAEERHAYMEKFLNRFFAEWDGKK